MEEMFMQVLKLGISVTWFIIIAAFLRKVLKKTPASIICLMWYMVWLRLIFPFNIESRFGLAPDISKIAGYMESRLEENYAGDSANEMEYDLLNGENEKSANNVGVVAAVPIETAFGDAVNKVLEFCNADMLNIQFRRYNVDKLSKFGAENTTNATDAANEADAANMANAAATNATTAADTANASNAAYEKVLAHWLRIGFIIWLLGMSFMFAHLIISYVALRRKLKTAVLYKENIRQSEFIDSPFIFGIIKPIIYIPYGLEETALDNILAHEKAHLLRRDHLAKFIAFILLGIYWFNPFIWLAYALFCKDIEATCDEHTIANMGEKERRYYALTLLSISGKRRVFDVCPTGFGEVGVKERILRIKRYKKPALGIVFASLLICVLSAVFFLSASKSMIKEEPLVASYYYYNDYWALYDMSDTAFPNKESLENLTTHYLKAAEELLDCGGWWKEINPQAKEIQVTYYMQDSSRCWTTIPAKFGEDAVAVSITLSKGILKNPDALFGAKEAKLAHEVGHVVLNNSFSISLEDGMCEYFDEQMSRDSIMNSIGISFQDVFCMDIQYGVENNKVGQEQLDKWKEKIGKEGRTYPYAEGGYDSSMWCNMSFSFASYLIDTYGISDVAKLVREGETQADYEKYLGKSLEELKEDWWNYVINYQSEYSIEEINQKILEYRDSQRL